MFCQNELRPEFPCPAQMSSYSAPWGFFCWRFVSLTPGPPPFSSMNSMPVGSDAGRHGRNTRCATMRPSRKATPLDL